MKTFLLISCFVVVCFGQNQKLIGTNRCTWGPSYWCSHVRHAKECGTMSSCMIKVWPKQMKDVKTAPQCTFCELAVKEGRRMLENKATEKELESFLSKTCAVIPSKSVKKECRELVSDYLPEMLALITSDVDAKVVCSAFGFCENKESKSLLLSSETAHPNIKLKGDNKTYCTDCKKFFADVQEIISSNTTKEDLKDLLYQYCTKVGPFKDLCRQVVDAEVDNLIAYLRQQIDPDLICSIIGFCRSSNIEKAIKMRLEFLSLTKKLTNSNEDTCSTCKLVVAELQQLIRNKAIESDVTSFIEQNLCTRLGEFAAECKSLVETYGQEIFQFLAAELDPNTFCTMIGLCTNSTKTVNSPIGMVPLLAAKSVNKLKLNEKCEICQFVVQELDNLIVENRTVELIRKALDKVCGFAPDTIKEQCLAFVKEYEAVLIELFANELNPVKVCEFLNLCEKKTMPVAHVPLIPLLFGGAPLLIGENDVEGKNDEACDLCKMVATLAEQMLEKNSTEEEIEKALEELCSYLPSEYVKECDSLVKAYVKQIVALISEELTPEEVCKEIGLCSQMDHLLGEKECSFGPAFWCASIENAKKCGTVEHCMKHAWNS